jgi:hypothetical protein
MASQLLLKTASGIFFTGVIAHTMFGINEVFQELRPIENTETRYTMKVYGYRFRDI